MPKVQKNGKMRSKIQTHLLDLLLPVSPDNQLSDAHEYVVGIYIYAIAYEYAG